MSDASHPLILGLFETATQAATAARTVRESGIDRSRVSIVARNHEIEGDVASASGSSPGSEIEDSAVASRFGELSAHLIAAIAVVLPGIGPIVADGPLAAGLGEAAGHLAGGVARALEHAGVAGAEAETWETHVRDGAILVGIHANASTAPTVRALLEQAGARRLAEVRWPD